MLKLDFSYDRKIDALNWVNTAKDTDPDFGFSYENSVAPIPDDLRRKIIKLQIDEAVGEVVNYLDSNKRQILKEHFINLQISSLTTLWQAKGSELISGIENIFGRFDDNDELVAYLTTLYICDYDFSQKYFYLSLYHSLPKNFTIIAHELSHFLFYRDYQKYCLDQGLNEKQFQDLKESTTVLLNEKEFANILLIEDQGYGPHQVLRNFIINSWQKNLSLKVVVDEAIEFITKNQVKD